MRTPKETSKIVEKTITEIRKAEKLSDKLITETCNKYDINEKFIRTVAGWKKEAQH